MQETILKTPLHAWHVAQGAQMMPFAGYDMPVRYSSDKQEHLCVREKVGLFDVSHMGEFLVRGPKALELLQRATSNDLTKNLVGKAQYNTLPNPQGGIVDDLIIYRLEEELFLVVVNASNIEKDWNWLSSLNTEGAEMQNLSEETALLALSGPLSLATLSKLTTAPVGDLTYYAHMKATVAGIDNVLVATTGYTGERTFELYVRADQAVKLWEALMEAGKSQGIQPIGLGARDTLRLEMGYMLYGNDITDTTSPLEAGLGWVTKLDKGVEFTAADLLRKQKAAGISRKLVAFELQERGIPRGHLPIVHNGQIVGEVTSGTFSPSLNKGIGLGYVPTTLSAVGTEIAVRIREKDHKAVVVKAPFLAETSLTQFKKA
ncbi:MAG: glycine cleavage system aminomethyltransferase GcvT [Bacteroidetes bacterium]|nr:glycine cleavage system aminomethyltransferase GcvT [Bacteroidota bacterium]